MYIPVETGRAPSHPLKMVFKVTPRRWGTEHAPSLQPGNNHSPTFLRYSPSSLKFREIDDRWCLEKLEKQLAFMREKDCALSYTSYMTCDESGKISSIVIGKRRETYFSMRCDDGIGCLTAVYDTEKVGKVFMPELRKRQDWGLWLTILRRCEVAYGLKEPLAIYRIHSSSISRNKWSLIKYNLRVYRTVLGYSPMASYLYFFILFLPSYFSKKVFLRLVNR